MKEIKLKHKSDEQINPISGGSIREISPTYIETDHVATGGGKYFLNR